MKTLRRGRRPLMLASTLLLSALGTHPALARSCDGVSQAVDEQDAAVRLDFLRARMHRGATYATAWRATWSIAYTGVSAYQAIALPFANHHDRIDHAFGLGGSLLGLGVLQVMPMKVMADDRRLERELASSPEMDRCAALADAERLLARDAAQETFAHGPLVHVGNFILNAGMGIALGVGFHHWTQAAIQGLSGIAVGELQTATQPSTERKTLALYNRGELSLQHDSRPRLVSVSPIAGSREAGLNVGFVF